MKNTFAFLATILALSVSILACTLPAGVGYVPTPTATPNAGEIALNMIQQQMAAEATSQIVGLQFTATAEILGATATSQAISTAEAIAQQARMDAQATSDQTRADAAATQQRIDTVSTAEQARQDAMLATGQAIIAAQSTQSANATATFTALTLTAIPGDATSTQIAVDNQIAISAKNVEEAELDLQRARDTNILKAYGPWTLVIFLAALLGVVVWRQSRWYIIKNGYGDVEGIGHDQKLINPRYLPGAVIDLKAMTMPQLTDKATQAEIIRNDQKIRALEAIPVNPSESGRAAFDTFFSREKKEEPFEIIEGDVLPPAELLDAETLKVTEKEWQDANNK